MMEPDEQLLRRYAQNRSEEAFTELVNRHCNLVWSAASRVLGDHDLARDAAQAAFADLARKADHLPRGTVLAGWLYRAACFAAAKIARGEARRVEREHTAMQFQDITKADPAEARAADDLQPLLDAALAELDEPDRNAVVLRFLSGRTLAEVGAAIGLNEDAAQKKVARALEKLRGSFRRRGVEATSGVVAAGLSAAGLQAAPAGVAGALAAGALAASGSLSAVPLLTLMKTKLLFGCAGLVMAGGLVTQHYAASRLASENESLRLQLAKQPASAPAVPAPDGAAAPAEIARLREEHGELMRLRGEYGVLLKQRTVPVELSGLTNQLAEARKEVAAAKAQARKDVERAYDGAAAMNESRDIIGGLKYIGVAARLFANDHNNLYPTTLEQMKYALPPQLPGNVAPESFEFVAQDPPLTPNDANLFLMREKAPRVIKSMGNGHFMRAYLNGDGSVQMMTSPDGNFDSIEAAAQGFASSAAANAPASGN